MTERSINLSDWQRRQEVSKEQKPCPFCCDREEKCAIHEYRAHNCPFCKGTLEVSAELAALGKENLRLRSVLADFVTCPHDGHSGFKCPMVEALIGGNRW